LVAPFLPVLAALVVVGVHVQLGHVLDRVTLVAAFVLVGVVLVRQALLIVDLLAQRDSVVGGLSGRVVVALSESAPDPRRRGAREGLG
jgi:hypothetical protein